MDAALITVSYRGDFELARDLCVSIDAQADPAFEHVLIVPRSDIALFQPLAGGRRRLMAVEEILPRNFVRLLQSCRIEIGSLFNKRLREIWLTPAGLVRGWIIQQIVKLSCDRATDRKILIFADSDLYFVRPLTLEHFARGDLVRLYQQPGATRDSASHRSWHAAAARLLSVPATDYFGADYIGNPVSWRRDVLQGLQERIAQATGRPWQEALAATPGFSEFILYGVYADHVLGKGRNGHFPDTEDLTHASWHYEDSPSGLERFVAEFGEAPRAILIQSTNKLDLVARRQLIGRMTNGLKHVA